jgi:acetyl-CoA C-acetyltransferase
MLTTQFFAMKIQRYMAEHGISTSTLAKVAEKAFANGARNPNAWRRTPLSEADVLGSKMVNHPLTQYMFCSPGEGAVALVLARGSRIASVDRPPV